MITAANSYPEHQYYILCRVLMTQIHSVPFDGQTSSQV